MTTKVISKALLAAIVTTGWLTSASALTATEAEGILYIKQEEKVARDVYQVLYQRWEHRTFANIAVSEQRHMDAVDNLIARYRLADTTPAEAGTFTIPELQDLYDQLVALGSQSLEDALAVGVLIEEKDIADLQEVISATRERPIRNVLINLMNGSYNHLAAFTRALN